MKIYLGKYLAGLPGATYACKGVDCTVSDTDYIFWHGTFTASSELGRIPRNSINQIIMDDKSVIQKRLVTVTRLALLGPFALAFPKRRKKEEYCLCIDWEDTNGATRHTLFEFSGSQASGYARLAADEMIKNQLPKTFKISPDEQKCPFCAEIIKKEARLCRFCRSPLDGSINET